MLVSQSEKIHIRVLLEVFKEINVVVLLDELEYLVSDLMVLHSVERGLLLLRHVFQVKKVLVEGDIVFGV